MRKGFRGWNAIKRQARKEARRIIKGDDPEPYTIEGMEVRFTPANLERLIDLIDKEVAKEKRKNKPCQRKRTIA